MSGGLRTAVDRCRRPLRANRYRWLDRTGFAAIAVAVVGFGFLQGTTPISVQVDVFAWTIAFAVLPAVWSALSFSGFLSLSGLLLFAQVQRGEDRPPLPTDGPRVDAVVPVYRDADALHRSVGSLLDSGYERLHVHVVCEPDDAASQRRARRFASEHDRVHVLVNDRYPGSKAGAINHAAEVTDGEYLAVFDGDERVDPAFVPSAVDRLDECDVVQGRTLPEPDGIVETVAYYESVLLGKLTHRLLGLVTGFRMAASRAVVMRRDAFEAVDGYDTAMLTEDFDFAIRCYEADLDVAEDFANPSRIEAAHSLSDWWGQRKRWMTGYAQVIHRSASTVRLSLRSVLAFAVAAGTVLGNLLLLSMVSKVVVLGMVGAEYAVVPMLATVVALALGVRVHDVTAGRIDRVGLGWLLAPLILPLYSLAGIKGMVEYLVSWNGEWYHAAKEAQA